MPNRAGSGSGKSTLLRCANALETDRTACTVIAFDGMSTCRASHADARRLRPAAWAWCSKILNCFPHLTVLRNVSDRAMAEGNDIGTLAMDRE